MRTERRSVRARRLIIHIGGAKCGSSAIQDHLARNHGRLRSDGVLVPSKGLTLADEILGQQIWFLEHLSVRPDGPDVLKHRIGRLGVHMEAKGLHTLIVSAENICNHRPLAEWFASAAEGFETQIVFYVRRQDDYFISAWQQWELKRFASMQAYVAEKAGHDANWLDMIAPWEAAFGAKAIVLRPFRRDVLHGRDVVTDFLQELGLPQDGYDPPKGVSNRSFDEHLGDLAHRAQDVFKGPHDNDFYGVMVRLIGEKAFKSRSASHLLSLDERLALLSVYDEGNRALRDRYLPEFGDRPLFDPPTPDDVAVPTEAEKLAAENALLVRALYRLARLVDDLEKAQRGNAAEAVRTP